MPEKSTILHKWLLVEILKLFRIYKKNMAFMIANSVDPGEMPRCAVSHQGLSGLRMPHLKDVMHNSK